MGIPTETLKAWAKEANWLPRRAIDAVLRRGGPAGRSFVARPPPARGMVGGDKAVSVVVPVRVVSTPNARTCRQAAARLVRHQRAQVQLWLGRVVLPAPPVRVVLTRIYCPARRHKPMDSDNRVAGCKAVRDQIAELYGCDDSAASPLAWADGGDEAGDAAGVRVELVPVRP